MTSRLTNRPSLKRALSAAHANGRHAKKGWGVILFSVDRFRLINSGLGYILADKVLDHVYRAAKEVMDRRGKVGRWGGDEFLCIVTSTNPRQIADHARTLCETIRGLPLPVETHLIGVTISVGTACAPQNGSEPDEMIRAADEALHEAKRRGRNQVVAANELTRLVLPAAGLLEKALREDRIVPAYQPIVELATGRQVADETLARIVSVTGKISEAHEFIDTASDLRLTYRIDFTMLMHALERCSEKSDTKHFVNISGDLLRYPELMAEVVESARNRLLNARMPSVPLVIEITERELLQNLKLVRSQLAPLVELGIGLALDDFGSGYSSFQYLADLPVSYVKIDGGLVRRIHEPKVLSIVRGIQNIAADLGLTTLAEYVETERQIQRLAELGVDWAQGHYFGTAILDQPTADRRREMSVNWTQGYYFHKLLVGQQP